MVQAVMNENIDSPLTDILSLAPLRLPIFAGYIGLLHQGAQVNLVATIYCEPLLGDKVVPPTFGCFHSSWPVLQVTITVKIVVVVSSRGAKRRDDLFFAACEPLLIASLHSQ